VGKQILGGGTEGCFYPQHSCNYQNKRKPQTVASDGRYSSIITLFKCYFFLLFLSCFVLFNKNMCVFSSDEASKEVKRHCSSITCENLFYPLARPTLVANVAMHIYVAFCLPAELPVLYCPQIMS
jgi:hypothetical protein